MIDNDAVVLGLLMVILGGIFRTSRSTHPFWRRLYSTIPVLLWCYFLPSLLSLSGLVDPESSQLYHVATRYLLPASLVLLTLSIDLREILRLGPKALLMFLAGTAGVVIGGPLAVVIVGTIVPAWVGGEDGQAVWRGLATVAGSWIGGGANQVAMKEIFQPTDALFSTMVAVDVVVAEVWMAALLWGIGKRERIDAWLRADSRGVDRLIEKMDSFSRRTRRLPETVDLFVILGLAFGMTGLAHWLADQIAPAIAAAAPRLSRFSLDSAFFWLILIATTGGVTLSFTPARSLEGVGASQIGTVFIYVLVATIGLQMDVSAVFKNPGAFVVGGFWMLIHIAVLVVTARLIKAPYFYLAVGSKANIGGAASAPVVAATFHPSLAPVGVLLAVLGYALGTYAAYLCALMMQAVATSP